MDKRFIIILIVVILGLGGLFIFNHNRAKAPGNQVGVSNHTEGNNTKHVALLVYGDFQCSACKAFFPIEKQVVEKYFNDISFTFRHFPLDSVHPNARAASRAAEAAGLQGKFFEMHDMLYENQESWLNQSSPQAVFDSFAKVLNLDVTKFQADFSSQLVNDTINADFREGTDKGINGTPTYILNGQTLNNEDISSVEKFSAKIDEAIKASANN
jgi:protein-disulfide isomerase